MEKESGAIETFLFNIQLRIICDVRTGRRIKLNREKIALAVSVKAGTLWQHLSTQNVVSAAALPVLFARMKW